MNILVIGNGFDLAHGLPTKYTDFLYFCSAVRCITDYIQIKDNIPKDDKEYIKWLDSSQKILAVDKELKNKPFYRYSIYMRGVHKFTKRDEKVYEEMVGCIKKWFFEDEIDIKVIKEILFLISDNYWIDYFLECDMHGAENWIDFESEISREIRYIDSRIDKVGMFSLDDTFGLYDKITVGDKHIWQTYFDKKSEDTVVCKVVRDKLESSLKKLIRLFEIYLTEYVEKKTISLMSPDIENIVAVLQENSAEKELFFSYVVNFNYTNTYFKVYLSRSNADEDKYIDYIHGKADIKNTIDSNNMVLGIDEYLVDEIKNKDVKFIAFKKFYQRICKQTGCKYKKWIDKIKKDYLEYRYKEIEEEKEADKYIPDSIPVAMKRLAVLSAEIDKYEKHNLYIFGHSLDVTDGDILKDLILNDNVYITIYYHDKRAKEQQIANLVKVIGQDELIRRTGGSTKTIDFKLQQNMVPLKNHK